MGTYCETCGTKRCWCDCSCECNEWYYYACPTESCARCDEEVAFCARCADDSGACSACETVMIKR